MFATDFLFNNLRASDLGLMICSFDSSPNPASGGEIEYNAVKTPLYPIRISLTGIF